MKFKYLLILTVVLLGCSKDNEPAVVEKQETRAFTMGFTAFPYDLTVAAQLETYEEVAANGDIFLNHLDHGVPWGEALNDTPFPSEVQNTLNATKTGLRPGTKILLTATPAGQNRKELAGYWNNEGSHQDLPAFWEGKSFDNVDVITAYEKYCKRIIDVVQPDYFAYGIETNASFQKDETAFTQFLVLAQSIYVSLKAAYPNLPIFLTLQDRSFENSHEALLETSKMLVQHSDYIAMSSYPFLDYNDLQRDADPQLFATTWLNDFRNLDVTKPFAISETGFCAEDLVIDNLGVNVKASEAWQKQYLEKLFEAGNMLDAEFLIWFVYRDYDGLYEKTPNPPDILKVWRDNGLLDGEGNPRLAFQEWQRWMALAKR